MASMSSEISSKFLKENQCALRKIQLAVVVACLEAQDSCDLVEVVQSEVGNGHHLTYFLERRQYWEHLMKGTELDDIIVALSSNYTTILQRCFHGKQNYAVFQVRWMEFVCQLLHNDSEVECSTTATKLWSRLTGDVDVTVDSKHCVLCAYLGLCSCSARSHWYL